MNKFHILSRTIRGSLDRVSAIMIACARLHNYIIREDKPVGDTLEILPSKIDDLDEFVPHPKAPLGMTYVPVVPNDDFHKFCGILKPERQ